MKTTDSQKRDMRFLEKHAPEPGFPIPAPAQLTMGELYEVERLANIGANLAQIGLHLRKPLDVWQLVVEHNPSVAEAFRAGFNRMQLEVMTAIKAGAMAGESSLLRIFADRILDRTPEQGPQWAPPKQVTPVLIAQPGAVQVNVLPSVREAFAAQRQLVLEAEAESEANSERS